MGTYSEYFATLPPDVKGYIASDAANAISACLAAQDANDIRGNIAEIGVYHGKTFLGLARATRPDEIIVGVDTFYYGEEVFGPDVERNVEQYLTADQRGRVVLHKALSQKLRPTDWQRILKQPARLVHIDGGHTREAVLHDFRLAVSFLADRGIIIFDDLFNCPFPDVTTGIIDALRSTPLVRPIAIVPGPAEANIGSAKLIVGHVDSGLAIYEQALMERLPFRFARRPFAGSENVCCFVREKHND